MAMATTVRVVRCCIRQSRFTLHGHRIDQPQAPERPRLDTRVHTINAALRAVDMALVSGKAPDDGTLYYTLVQSWDWVTLSSSPIKKGPFLCQANTRSDEVAQLATVYEPVEVDFLKHIVSFGDLHVVPYIDCFSWQLAMIFRDSGMTYEVSSSDAQNAASQAQGRKFTKAEAETFLKSLVKEGWLRDR